MMNCNGEIACRTRACPPTLEGTLKGIDETIDGNSRPKMMKSVSRCCRNQAVQLIVLLIFIPVALVPLVLPIAGAVAGYENWEFSEGFEFVMCGLLRMAVPTGPGLDVVSGNVTEYKLKKIATSDAAICEIFIGVASLTTFGFILNKVNTFHFGERLAKTVGGIFSKRVKGHDNKLMVEVAIMTFVTYPLLVLVFAMIFGDIVAAAEGKSFGVGIMWSFGNILNTNRVIIGGEMAVKDTVVKVVAWEFQMIHLFLQAVLLDYIVNLVWYKHQIGTSYQAPAVAETKESNLTVSTEYENSNTENILKAPTPVKSGTAQLPPLNA